MLMLAGVVVTTSTFAAENQDEVTAKIEAQLGFDVLSVADAPVEGLYQVVTDKGLFYISKDGKYLVQARIYNLEANMRNETEAALGDMRREGLSEFSDAMIEYKADDEEHVITVFTDITCGYCRKLHQEIDQYNDMGITVRYLAFPRNGLNSQSYRDMVSVWCAENPQKALTAAKAGDNVLRKSCKNSVAEQYQFGQQVGVTGTPNIVMPDGSVIPGYQPAKAIAQVLKSKG
ncbi:bifunctional protein-disulfide isomerase/oxidoreductase DsbC [Alteromonas sp. ASW11-19]|uniref:Thiol:disulfide interchange protein n=1 Tax=Alteromonas salexigens TaxID=2982530 RepID=A0ABT2VIX0_9ALTE|nr:bifunctional protein-disulfide isomerase/oxidoreductase DsbC [Alteromonas salexigens]MCU7553115.1 bifunctional protein-disulfide isomerase/oxidoreductase DsbC [Alteromonas salexigens]